MEQVVSAYTLTVNNIPRYVGKNPKSAHKQYCILFRALGCEGQVKTVESLYMAVERQGFWQHNYIVGTSIVYKFEITRTPTDFPMLEITLNHED